VMPFVSGAAGSTLAYRMNDAGLPGNVIFNMSPNVWYNVWLVVDNAAQTYSVYHSTGTSNGTFGGTATRYWQGYANTPLNALGFMASGGSTTSLLVDNVYRLRGANTSYPIGATAELVPAGSTLAVAGDFALAAGATLELDVATGSLHDKLVVGGHFNASGTLKVSLDPAQPRPVPGDSFDLFDATTATINFSSILLPALEPGLEWDTSAISSGILSVTGMPQQGYAAWTGGHAFAPGTEGELFDADLDGIANVFEWLFGSDPLAADPDVLPVARARPATAGEFPGADSSKTYLSIAATVRKNTPGWTLVPQAASSPDLLDEAGSSAHIQSLQLEDLGEFEKREWIHTLPIENTATGFMRLKLIGE
jgi:hypothetical protein